MYTIVNAIHIGRHTRFHAHLLVHIIHTCQWYDKNCSHTEDSFVHIGLIWLILFFFLFSCCCSDLWTSDRHKRQRKKRKTQQIIPNIDENYQCKWTMKRKKNTLNEWDDLLQKRMERYDVKWVFKQDSLFSLSCGNWFTNIPLHNKLKSVTMLCTLFSCVCVCNCGQTLYGSVQFPCITISNKFVDMIPFADQTTFNFNKFSSSTVDQSLSPLPPPPLSLSLFGENSVGFTNFPPIHRILHASQYWNGRQKWIECVCVCACIWWNSNIHGWQTRHCHAWRFLS